MIWLFSVFGSTRTSIVCWRNSVYKNELMVHLHWWSFDEKTLVKSQCDISFFTCLGQVTEIEMILYDVFHLLPRFQINKMIWLFSVFGSTRTSIVCWRNSVYKNELMVHLHWRSFDEKTLVKSQHDIYFFTCLGQVTEIEMILSVSHRPRLARQVYNLPLWLMFLPANVANVHEPLERFLSSIPDWLGWPSVFKF
jgi:hypothetical protein